jgi:type II secretory pathway pseudopilin PulG
MRRRPAVGRGRPGLIGTMARTAVVAGTATATVGAVSGHQQRKQQAAAQEQAATAEQQQEMAQMQQQMNQLQAQQASAQPQPAGGGDTLGQLQKLADMRTAGLLTDDEFAAAKAKLLAA